MKIKSVEELVGITKKNIRFYEAQGLLEPGRTENGYRDYSLEDVKRLKQVKLLRQLAIPIEEIRAIFEHELELEDCLEKQVVVLEKQEKQIASTREMLKHILTNQVALSEQMVDEYLEKMETLEKEGSVFMDVARKDMHKKKQRGALAGAGIMLGILLLMVAIMIVILVQAGTSEILPVLFVLIPLVLVGAGIIVALIMRMKEIEGGEEDEASKY